MELLNALNSQNMVRISCLYFIILVDLVNICQSHVVYINILVPLCRHFYNLYILSVCHPVHMSVCHPVCLSVCYPVCLSVCYPVHMSVTLSVCYPVLCLSVCYSVHMSVCYPVCHSVCSSIRSYTYKV